MLDQVNLIIIIIKVTIIKMKLLLQEGHIKIADFGMCKEGLREGATTKVVTTHCCNHNYLILTFTDCIWSAGPSGIKNLNPGIFRDGILPNPGIPGFFGTGFPNIFDPGIKGNSFGIFIFASFTCQIGSFLSIFIIAIFIIITTTIVLYHHHLLRSLLATLLSHYPHRCQKSYSYHANYSSNVLKGMWRSVCSSESLSKIMHLPHQSQLKSVFKVSLLNASW